MILDESPAAALCRCVLSRCFRRLGRLRRRRRGRRRLERARTGHRRSAGHDRAGYHADSDTLPWTDHDPADVPELHAAAEFGEH
ncbi:MAG: hypothetical protein QOD39_1226 [Mycobacterium sp.]|nr:hypothetical protein [Mycobacterium sp.]